MERRSDTVSEIVVRAIIDKRLRPGCKLSEQTLAGLFNTSRAVIQQAIIRLSDKGLVTVERNRGASIARPTYREAVELYDAMTMIEQGVAAQLCGRLGVREWAVLREHVSCQHKVVTDDNKKAADQLGAGFHEVFVSMSHNTVVQDLHAGLVRRTALFRSLSDSRFDYHGLLHDHGRLVDLLENGDLFHAQQLIDTHHRDIVKGFILDQDDAPVMSATDALAPYVKKNYGSIHSTIKGQAKAS